MALDVGIELRRGEAAAQHVALELRHVDAVGGEAAHRLVERRRHVAHAEDEGGDDQAAVIGRDARSLRHDQEPRRVVAGVLDILLQRDQAMDLARELRGDRGLAAVAPPRHFRRGAGRVRHHDRLQPERAD